MVSVFTRIVSAMENRYKDKWNAAMVADYSWTVKRGATEIQYKR